jgi:hypothetical protein
MKSCFVTACLLSLAVTHGQSQTYVDLTGSFNADTVLEAGGTGQGDALDAQGRRVDGATLPSSYADGSVVTTPDGRAKFKFGPLRQSAKDAVLANGQVLDVTDGIYGSLDLALLSAPGALAYPFGEIELRYSDGSKEPLRLGPVPGWFNSPMQFDHTLYRYTDSSQVQTIASFATDWGDAEAVYLYQQSGNGNSGGNRFVDAAGYALYRIGDLASTLKAAKLGVTVGNNFVISLATEFHDPSESTTDGYTVVANSMDIYGGVDHHALGNLKQYDFDLAPFLASGTGELYILFTDASPSDGWGPFIQRIQVYTGTARSFEQALEPAVDSSKATVYGMFTTSTDAEKPFLYDNSASGPSNRGHRFADANQSLTYRFDLPDNVTNANLVVDMANNFIVSLSGASLPMNYFSMNAIASEDANFLVDAGGSAAGGDFRFADGTTYMIYQFDLPDNVTKAYANIRVGNEFVIEAASGTNGEFKVEKDWVAETGEETHDITNLAVYTVDLSSYLTGNPSKVVQLRFSDGVPADGWGPYLKSIAIVNSTNVVSYEPVLDSQTVYGEDIRDEYNKKYYTFNLASLLATNATREFSVKFTDGSTSDGWGPGVFWMAVYSGELAILGDQLVFNNLKSTTGEPVNYGVDLLHRRYAVNSAKTLASIALPPQTTTEDNKVYVLAATLNTATATTAPQLSVALLPQNKVRLSWPASAAGYRLQSTQTVGNSGSWTDVTDPTQTTGDQVTLDVATTGSGTYYRLTK